MPKKIKQKQRLTSEERRQAILDAAVPLFAAQGFRGVTTRHLAREAGISEALLYQHFPSKEALYAEVQDYFCQKVPDLEAELNQAPPSTETLVLVLYLVSRILIEPWDLHRLDPQFPRLMLQSLTEDGAFARLYHERRLASLSQLMVASLAAARRAGDLGQDDGITDELRFWMAHNVLVSVHPHQMPEEPLPYYSRDRAQLRDQALRFALRGLGLTQAAIARCYRPVELEATLARWFAAVKEADHGETVLPRDSNIS